MNNLPIVRRQFGMSIYGLARAAGISQSHLTDMEKMEDLSLTITTLHKIAQVFGMSRYELLRVLDSPDPLLAMTAAGKIHAASEALLPVPMLLGVAADNHDTPIRQAGKQVKQTIKHLASVYALLTGQDDTEGDDNG